MQTNRSMQTTVAVTVAIVLAATAACGAIVGKMVASAEHEADNPLISGQPIEAEHAASVGVVSEADCSIWPFQDVVTVRGSEEEICIVKREHRDAPPGTSGAPTADATTSIAVTSDTSPGGTSISATRTGASKVGTCFNKGYNQQTSIWVLEYEGCGANGGTLTAATQSLWIGSDAWRFPAPAASAESAAN
jgi:hypothetical protein